MTSVIMKKELANVRKGISSDFNRALNNPREAAQAKRDATTSTSETPRVMTAEPSPLKSVSSAVRSVVTNASSPYPEPEEGEEDDSHVGTSSRGGRGGKKRPAEVTLRKASKRRKTGPRPDDATEVNSQVQEASASPPHDVTTVIAQVREADPLCSIPSFPQGNPPNPDILRLASAVRSRAAIALLRDLVKEWRSGDARSQVPGGGERLKVLGSLIDRAESTAKLDKFRLRFGQAWFAAEIDRTILRGQKRLDSRMRKVRMDKLGWTKSKFEYQLGEGRKWNRICGKKFQGIIAFIFTSHRNVFSIAPSQLLELGRQDEDDTSILEAREEFHGLLHDHYMQILCNVGKALEWAIVERDPRVEFKWETLPDSLDWTTLPEPELLSYLQPYEPVMTNVYSPTCYPDWPRPEGWPEEWAWPADPLSEGVVGCDDCKECDGQCLARTPKYMPFIRHYGSRGLGLQAVGKAPGRVAYRKSQCIGYLFGKVTPPNSSGEDRYVEFARPDIPSEPVVCHLECLDSSNHFRLLQHDCNPVAELKPRKISSQYVLAVVAKQDIMDGTELTISYSRHHYGRKCLCGTCENRWRAQLPEGKHV